MYAGLLCPVSGVRFLVSLVFVSCLWRRTPRPLHLSHEPWVFQRAAALWLHARGTLRTIRHAPRSTQGPLALVLVSVPFARARVIANEIFPADFSAQKVQALYSRDIINIQFRIRVPRGLRAYARIAVDQAEGPAQVMFSRLTPGEHSLSARSRAKSNECLGRKPMSPKHPIMILLRELPSKSPGMIFLQRQ